MIDVLPYDPTWPKHFASEAAELRALAPPLLVLEHIGSTAVPGLAAKPVIDMMAAVARLDDIKGLLPVHKSKSYSVIATGMRDRFLLSRDGPPQFNLHIVTWESWPLRKERLMRD
ncbi:GrpB family protein, partial [Tabrizicola sp.]|uniref:GrpB family protein n=1 Tax=Tabrizicola sp. TaxID=2005166 RepID=UPI003F3B68F2